jgi:hypothetical protein
VPLAGWTTQVQVEVLPRLHAFTRGPDLDHEAAKAALTCEYPGLTPPSVTTRVSDGAVDWPGPRARAVAGAGCSGPQLLRVGRTGSGGQYWVEMVTPLNVVWA